MKKFSVCLFAVLAMVACGNSNNNQVVDDEIAVVLEEIKNIDENTEVEEFIVDLPQSQTDSANFFAGYLTGFQIQNGYLKGDNKEKTIDAFIRVLEEAYNGKESTNKYGLEDQMFQGAQEIGKSIRKQEQESGFMGFKGLPTNFELIKEGFNKGLNGDTTSIKPQEAVEYMENIFQPLSVAYQEAQMKKAQVEGIKFLRQNAKREGVKSTASGLQYEVIVEGEGEKPAEDATVKVHYEGTLTDGTVFDSSYKRGEPISFPLNRVIKGWTEGLQLMGIGSKYKLYIPYYLAYGEQGNYAIPPFSTLIFTVELLDIEKPEVDEPESEEQEEEQEEE